MTLHGDGPEFTQRTFDQAQTAAADLRDLVPVIVPGELARGSKGIPRPIARRVMLPGAGEAKFRRQVQQEGDEAEPAAKVVMAQVVHRRFNWERRLRMRLLRGFVEPLLECEFVLQSGAKLTEAIYPEFVTLTNPQ